MTEEQANTKWCPMAQIALNSLPSGGVSEQKCCTSECMMWRWKVTPEEAVYQNRSVGGNIVEDGHCGLGGAK